MNKKKQIKLVELLVEERNNVHNKAYTAHNLGISVEELKNRIKTEICPIGKKDLERNIASEEACIYLSFEAEEALAKNKIYNSSVLANIRQIYPEYINGTDYIKGIKSVEVEAAEAKYMKTTYNITGIVAQTLKWAAQNTVVFTNKVIDLFGK